MLFTLIYIIISIVIWIIVMFIIDYRSDNNDLKSQTLEEKFGLVVSLLNAEAYNGQGYVTKEDKRNFNLYKDGANQIIWFAYSTGHLTITWRYKFFQIEVVHKKTFNNVRDVNSAGQQKMAEIMISEMSIVIENHKKKVTGDI